MPRFVEPLSVPMRNRGDVVRAATTWSEPLTGPLARTLPVDMQVSACLSSGAVGDVFKALADLTRRAILDELVGRNGQTLFELCSRLTMRHGLSSSRQAISQHLDVLESAGPLGDGRHTAIRLADEPDDWRRARPTRLRRKGGPDLRLAATASGPRAV